MGDPNVQDSSLSESVQAEPNSHVNVNRIEIGEKTLSVFALALAAMALMGSVWSIVQSQKSEREARMLQYYVLEMDAKLIAAGVKKPEEAVAKKEAGK